MTTHEINTLIERYLDGETTLAEERELALAVQREDRPAEWAIIAEMLGELTVDEAVYDEIMDNRKRKPAKRLTRLWPWAAAACVALAFGLSYNNIKEEPQEMAKAEMPPSAQPKPENKPATKPLLASTSKPLTPKPQRQIEQPPVEAPPFEASMEEPLIEAQAEAPLPEPQPQLIAEVEEPIPSEDLALCMALLAEVEARAIELQQQSNRPELSL